MIITINIDIHLLDLLDIIIGYVIILFIYYININEIIVDIEIKEKFTI